MTPLLLLIECDDTDAFCLCYYGLYAGVTLNPLPSCVKQTGEKKYPDITAGQYLAQRLKEIGLKY